ncbi:recombinase family protein [Streptomyces roseolus]
MTHPTLTRRRHTNPDPSATGTYAAYLRVSSREQVTGYGLDTQDATVDQWFTTHPHHVLFAKYRDKGVSGAAEERPEKRRLEGDAERGLFNRIVVPRIDRIGRTARASYNWAWQMSDLDIHFVSITENIDTGTPCGWQAFQQYVQFSELEWTRIRERTIDGRDMKITKGGWPAGPPPYGYEIVGRGRKGSHLRVNQYEAFVLHTAVGLVVDDRMSLPKTAAELNRRRLLPRSGKPWTATNLYQRLHAAPILHGHTTYRKTHHGKRKKDTTLSADGTPLHGPSRTIPLDRIFDEDRVEELRRAFTRTARPRKAQENRLYPLTGRVNGSCGKAYAGGGRLSERAYRCSGRNSDNPQPCDDANLDANEVEGKVWNEVCKLLADRDHFAELAAESRGSVPGVRDKYLRRKAGLVADIEHRTFLIAESVPKYVEAGLEPEVAAAAIARLREERDQRQRQLEEVEHWLGENDLSRVRTDGIAALSRKSQGDLRTMSEERRAEVFALFGISVTPLDHRFRKRCGAQCKVAEWHRRTGLPVPADVTVEQWNDIETLLRQRHGVRHFTMAKMNLREALNAMLCRLRTGVRWAELAETAEQADRLRQRQAVWFRSGTWQVLMDHLGGLGEGTPVCPRPKSPALLVSGRIRPGVWWVSETESGKRMEIMAEDADLATREALRKLSRDAEELPRGRSR